MFYMDGVYASEVNIILCFYRTIGYNVNIKNSKIKDYNW